MPNILLIWDRLGDYHRARANALAAVWDQGHVYTADLGNADRLYGWSATADQDRHFRLSARPVERFDFFRRIGRFIRIVRLHRIRILGIAGYGRPEYPAMLLLGRLLGCRIILFAESWYPGSRWFDVLKGFLLRMFVHGFFVSGSRAEQHFTGRLGIPVSRIRIGYSVVDNHHFMGSRVHEFMSSGLNRVNEDVTLSGIPPSPHPPVYPSTHLPVHPSTHPPIHPSTLSPYLLCVARYSPEKNLPFLIEAYRRSALYRRWKLVLAGDGPERTALERQAGADLNEHILLTGWIGYGELPAWYRQAQAFVLASWFEPWGLAVNEAMAAGLPVLVSEACGCVPELIDRENGYIFVTKNPEELVAILNQMAAIPEIGLRRMGQRSQEKIKLVSPERWGAIFKELCGY
jgi:1,2-diacylglycerol 3-alpha-glucosyltransferase